MRKHYRYALTLVIFVLSVWISYYFYLEYRTEEYINGTFVEVPQEILEETWELAA